jgi:alkyldihydroxyacetonephosphate synthase
MQRWNGWGDENIYLDLPTRGLQILHDLIGEGQGRPDYPLEKFIERIPKSRLATHPLISFDPKLRLDHAHGQSLPDWIGLRGGTLQRFPDGVALPNTLEEIQDLLRFAIINNIVVIPYGGGTSVVGHLEVPETRRPVLSLSLERFNRLAGLDRDSRLATFEAGIRGPQLEHQLNSKGFTLGHYPQSFDYSSLGGWVVTRSSGQQSEHYGRIEQLFAGGDVLTPRGSLNLPSFPASAAGPDLRQILLGSEGRMGVLTNVVVKMVALPKKDDVYGVFFPSWERAVHAVRTIAGTDISFSMMRLSNPAETMTNLALAGNERQTALLARYLRLRGISEKNACMCLVGFTGSHRLTAAARRAAFSIIRRYKGICIGKPMGNAWKKNRFQSAYLRNTLWDLGYALDTLETAITWDKVTPAMQAIETSLHEALKPDNERIHVFSHLSHVYPSGSSIYTTFLFRLSATPGQTLEAWKRLKQAASQTIVAVGGTISHQHGVGADHKKYMAAEKGAIGIQTLEKMFNHLDPGHHMNPGKLLPEDRNEFGRRNAEIGTEDRGQNTECGKRSRG